MTLRHNPVGSSHRLRGELRRLRVAAGYTQRRVADALEWSVSKIVRIESGSVGISNTDLRALLQLYHVDDQDHITRLVQLGRSRRNHGWWDDYAETFGQHFRTFLGLEASAARIRQTQALLIPGLLQTEDYARAAITGYGCEPGKIDVAVEVRMKRQELFDCSDAPEMVFVMDEAALRRVVGSAGVMRAQLKRLVELNEQPKIDIRVVPFDRGAHPGARESFILLEFDAQDQTPVIYLEHPQRDILVEHADEETRRYVETFRSLQELATPPGALDGFIDDLLHQAPYGKAAA